MRLLVSLPGSILPHTGPGSEAASLTARFHTPPQCLGVRLLVLLPGSILPTQCLGVRLLVSLPGSILPHTVPVSEAASLTARFHTPTQCLGVRLLVSLPGSIPPHKCLGMWLTYCLPLRCVWSLTVQVP